MEPWRRSWHDFFADSGDDRNGLRRPEHLADEETLTLADPEALPALRQLAEDLRKPGPTLKGYRPKPVRKDKPT